MTPSVMEANWLELYQVLLVAVRKQRHNRRVRPNPTFITFQAAYWASKSMIVEGN